MPRHRASLRFFLSLAFLLGTLLLCGLAQAGARFVHYDQSHVHAADVAASPQAPDEDGGANGSSCSLEDNTVDDAMVLPAHFSLHLAFLASSEPHSRFPALISGFVAQDLRPPIA